MDAQNKKKEDELNEWLVTQSNTLKNAEPDLNLTKSKPKK